MPAPGTASRQTSEGISSGLPPVTLPFADSNTARLNGIIGGGQLGYNYQFGPQWVLGFEADIQGTGERGSNTFVDPLSGGPICRTFALGSGCIEFVPVSGAAVTSYEAKIEWFGTVRGRVGVLLNDGLLLYGTGGLAYGRVSVSGNINENVSIPFHGGIICCDTVGATSPFSQSRVNIGFAVGGGLEGRLAPWLPPNWTWKLEYLYIDLGSLDTSTSLSAGAFPLPFPPFPTLFPLVGTMTAHTHFTDNIVRVGLNYQFH
jgi:outer membrane immunogenic protein